MCLPIDKPLTLRAAFPADISPVKSPLALRFVWPAETTPNPSFEVGPENKKIPKPPGQLSRLSRGDYSLEQTLGWEKSVYLQVQVNIINIMLRNAGSNMQIVEGYQTVDSGSSRKRQTVYVARQTTHKNCL